jgi:predicted thioesterase|tara:strand:- start:81 stop:455 length:375 start_codon:yes stop_codon:yes gene_type:complete
MPTGKLAPGDAAEIEVEVTKDLSTNRTGRPGADVLSTPSLLKLMELCSIEATDRYLKDGYATVGYAVDGLRHLAPTSIGAVVKVKAVITEVNGTRLSYKIEALEGDQTIGVATHKRAVISKDGS